MATIPSRKATFTEAGQIGKDIRSKLGSAVKAAGSGAKWGYNYINDFVTEYGQEPLLNLYPKAVNLFAAGGEVAAGMADKPVSLGRFPYYDLKTQFDKRESSDAPAIEAPKEQEEVETITVTKKAARPQKLWRVMAEGGNASEDTFYDNEDDARKALAAMGGKGAVAGIGFPTKSKEEESALKEQYKAKSAMKSDSQKGLQPKTEEQILTRKLTEAGATPEQRARYMKTLSESRQRGRERAGYAEEYAELGKTRTPTAMEERTMAAEARDRRMSNFLTRNEANKLTEEKERSFKERYNYLKRAEREARKSKRYQSALAAKTARDQMVNNYAGGIKSSTDRRRYFQQLAMQEAESKIKARDAARRKRFEASTTAAPETSSLVD